MGFIGFIGFVGFIGFIGFIGFRVRLLQLRTWSSRFKPWCSVIEFC